MTGERHEGKQVLQRVPDLPCLDRREDIWCASHFSTSMNYIYLVILGTPREGAQSLLLYNIIEYLKKNHW